MGRVSSIPTTQNRAAASYYRTRKERVGPREEHGVSSFGESAPGSTEKKKGRRQHCFCT